MTDRSSWLFASPKCMKRLASQNALRRCQGQRPRFTGSLAAPLRSRGAQPCRRRSAQPGEPLRSLPGQPARGSAPGTAPLRLRSAPHRGHPPKLSPAACARSRSPPRENVLSLAPSVQRARGGGWLLPSCLTPASLRPRKPHRGSRIAPPSRAERGARAAHPPRRRPRPRLAE